jgi:uncharacterized protein (DUF4415 family)
MQMKKPSGAMSAFETELLESVRQAVAGDFRGAAVRTPQALAAKRGRPFGSHKSPTTLRVDEMALQRWRASGKGWQTRAAAVLAKYAPA